MKLKLAYVESDFRGKGRLVREEVLEGESGKPMTKSRALKLLNRFHPEFRALIVNAYGEFPAKWLVHTEKKDSNLWLKVYASPEHPTSLKDAAVATGDSA